jgi:uncharacterized RDD family membrane protein YckC
MIITKKIDTGKRIGSMILDHVIMSVICLLFFIPKLLIDNNDINFLNGPLGYLALVGFALYFLKDSFDGRSIGKRIMKLQVVDSKMGKAASPIQCFIRNIFIIIWPIEVIIVLFNTEKRIGDRVAGTKLITYNPDQEQAKVKWLQIIISFILSFLFLLIITSFFTTLNTTPKKIPFIKDSLSNNETELLEKLYADSMYKYVIPNIKVYDKIKNREGLKYISAIFQLKENYFEDGQQEELKKIINASIGLLISKFPEKTFAGTAEYYFKTDNGSDKIVIPIGVQN